MWTGQWYLSKVIARIALPVLKPSGAKYEFVGIMGKTTREP